MCQCQWRREREFGSGENFLERMWVWNAMPIFDQGWEYYSIQKFVFQEIFSKGYLYLGNRLIQPRDYSPKSDQILGFLSSSQVIQHFKFPHKDLAFLNDLGTLKYEHLTSMHEQLKQQAQTDVLIFYSSQM